MSAQQPNISGKFLKRDQMGTGEKLFGNVDLRLRMYLVHHARLLLTNSREHM
jgi:hypothetical protein